MACLIRLDNGQIFNISNKIDIIGRGSSASIFLDEDGVSRNHAEIFMMSGCVEVIDLNSRNGIKVNGNKVRKSFLNDGDKLNVGSVDLVFSNETVNSNQTINIANSTTKKEETAPPIHSSASGRFELQQIKPEESLLRINSISQNQLYLELLFKASLDFNNSEIKDRFKTVVYNYIQKNLTPTVCHVKFRDEVLCETPNDASQKASQEIFNATLTSGVAYLRKQSNSMQDGTSAISCPILDDDRNIHGIVYLESSELNYEIEDIMFVRAICALAAGVKGKASKVKTLPGISSQFHPDELLILGSSDAVIHLKTRIEELANEQTVMISGPPGTDRRVVGNNIHCMSNKAEKPYVFVDCSSLNPAVLHESLFGRAGISIGKFGQAKGGTLFLNRICCIDKQIQELIHLFIQTRSIIPLGESEPQAIDVDLVLGIRGRPEDAVKRGVLCENLLTDMKGKRIHIPYLRERQEDILEIADHYFKRFTKKYRKTGMILSEKSKETLTKYPWPGNDRELDLVMERAVLCCDHQELTPEYLTLPGVK
ncbi:MAG: sigma 54-interacting transcriptional regulator [Lentisphaerales bacterium]|nr:sigma 54-interacting transcriptional regulator [Lentisphaerales bacterium]